MLVVKSSVFNCSSDIFFSEIKKSKSHRYVSRPLIVFKPIKGGSIPEIWKEGKFPVLMRLFGFIPFGKQWIVVTVDQKNMHIRDNGYSNFVKKWDHNVYVRPIADGKTLYTDAVEVKAGIFTLAVYLFAKSFYAHRQRRWKKLIRSNFSY